MKRILHLLFFIGFLSISFSLSSQGNCRLYGKIIDQNGEPAPFTAVYVEKLQRSSMANEEGEFQINLPLGKHDITFQNLSYEMKTMSIQLKSEEQELLVEMRSIAYALQEVEVDPSSEDPAYNIIRKAIAMSEYYKRQRESFKAKLYARTSFNVNDIPWLAEKFMEEEDIRDAKAGYIVETLSEYTYEKGGKIKERVIAQKSAFGDTLTDGANYLNLDFYQIGGSTIVNPLSRSSFSVYKFEYQASLYEDGQQVHKIKIIPRRKGNDLMAGEIYINDKLWNINKVNIQFDVTGATIYYKQLYREVKENVWFPMNHRIEGQIKFAGFKADFRYLASIKEVEVETDSLIDAKIKEKIALQKEEWTKKEKKEAKAEEKELAAKNPIKKALSKAEKREEKINELIEKEKLTKGESLKLYRLIKKQQAEIEEKEDTSKSLEIVSNRTVVYDDSARAKNDSLWKADRQIPLAEKEKSIYVKTDSIKKVDDGDTIVNEKRSVVGNILFFEGRLKTENKALFLRPKGILSGVGGYFNTVDGWTITKKLGSIEKNKRKGKFYSFEPSLSYAFARDRLLGEASFVYQYKKKSASQIRIKGGSQSSDFNGEQAMDPTINSIATLFFLENFPKFYQRNYIEIEHRSDLNDQLSLNFGMEYNDRERLENNTSQNLSIVGDGEYSSNIPLHPDIIEDNRILKSHQSAIFNLELSYQNNQYYRFRRGKKIKYPSSKPKFYIGYRQGIPDLFDSDAQFTLLKAGIERSFSYRLIDRISYKLEGGSFLNNDQLFFADYQAFNVNPFEFNFIRNTSSFALLPYYTFNSSDYYIQAHTNLRNNFILLKYLPLLNRTEWKEEIGLSYLYTEAEQHYYEFSYGLTQILLVLDVKAYVSFLDHEYADFGLRVSFAIDGSE